MTDPQSSSDRVMLVDGHSVAYRAYHALPPSLVNAAGKPAHAFYGFLNILLRVLNDHHPTHLAVTFDCGAPFRRTLFDAYKASRHGAPADFPPQVVQLRQLLVTWHVPIFEAEGFEADDILATLARQARARHFDVDVLSGDLDVLQLVGPGVRVIAPGKTFALPVVYDAGRVRERYGVEPAQLVDWKALVGDSSDEIPGVAGIGKKSATVLLQEKGSLAAIYDDLAAIASPRLRTALADGREAAELSRRLVMLREDAPVKLDLEPSRIASFDRRAAAAALNDLGFKALGARIAPA